MNELFKLMAVSENYNLHSEERMLLQDTAEAIDSADPKVLIKYIEDFGLVYSEEYLEHFKNFMRWNACAIEDIEEAIEQYENGDDTGLNNCACYFNDGLDPKNDILKFLKTF